MKRQLVRVVRGHHGNRRASQASRRKADQRPVDQVCLHDLGSPPAQLARPVSQPRPGTRPGTGTEREGRDAERTHIVLERPGGADAAHGHVLGPDRRTRSACGSTDVAPRP